MSFLQAHRIGGLTLMLVALFGFVELVIGCRAAAPTKNRGGGARAVAAPTGGEASPEGDPRVRIRPLTRGPKFHWFGYYDKLQSDPSGRYVLGMEVDFESRSPTENDVIKIGMVDTAQGDRWIELGESRAWGWQQGCMLQWRPGSDSEVLWNDREGASFVTRVLNVKTGARRTLPKAIYAVSPDGRWAIGTEFSRLQNMRPGYGYAGIPDPFAAEQAPKDIGIYRMDLNSGEHRLLVSLADVAKLPHEGQVVEGQWHWVNHLLVAPDGKRFVFLHRWRTVPITESERRRGVSGSYETRMFTADLDGNLHLMDPSGQTSHFIWRDTGHVLAWTKPQDRDWGFYLFKDVGRDIEHIGAGVMTENGHQTYLPLSNLSWILNDTYPSRPERKQTVYLFHVPTAKKIVLGRFLSPSSYTGEWRCDTHPRSLPDGTRVVIDSNHAGNGRQMYELDITAIVRP